MDVTDKVVIVTGASRGIGRQIALEFGRRGASVVIAARTIEPRRTFPGTLSETVSLIELAGGRALAVPCDVAEPTDVERLVSASIESFGRIDVVVNNAADMVGGDFEKLIKTMLGKSVDDTDPVTDKEPLHDWLQQFAVNVHGPYYLTTLAVPRLRAAGGGIVINITSGAAEMVPLATAIGQRSANPSLGYHVTKATLNRMTNSLAAKLAADNIAVVAVDPGTVRTEVAEIGQWGSGHWRCDDCSGGNGPGDRHRRRSDDLQRPSGPSPAVVASHRNNGVRNARPDRPDR